MTIRPKPSSWLLLFIPTGMFIFLGVVSLYHGDFLGSLNIVVSAAVILYNATSVVTINHGRVMLRRYGVVMWRVDLLGARIKEGRVGEIPVLKGLLLFGSSGEKGHIITGIYHKRDITRMLEEFAKEGAVVRTVAR